MLHTHAVINRLSNESRDTVQAVARSPHEHKQGVLQLFTSSLDVCAHDLCVHGILVLARECEMFIYLHMPYM